MSVTKRRLTSLPGLLHAGGYTDVPIYKVLHQHAVNGVIPGAHQINHSGTSARRTCPRSRPPLGWRRRPRHPTATPVASRSPPEELAQ